MEKIDSILSNILEYANFLNESGYPISFSFLAPEIQLNCPFAYRYDAHLCSVCSYLKRNPTTINDCHKNKLALIKKAPTAPYYGCCYAGVEEYVVPILHDNIPIVFVHVYGYRNATAKSDRLMRHTAKRCSEQFPDLYQKLSLEPPSLSKVISFTTPFKFMFSALYEACLQKATASEEQHLLNQILKYVYEHYINNITYADIARELHYSESHLRHLFRTHTNKTIKQFILELQLKQAMDLLNTSEYTVTEIATLVGFNDPNHFSVIFKKKFGVTPMQYKKHRKS